MLMSGPEATLGVSPWMSAAMPPSAFETSATVEILTQQCRFVQRPGAPRHDLLRLVSCRATPSPSQRCSFSPTRRSTRSSPGSGTTSGRWRCRRASRRGEAIAGPPCVRSSTTTHMTTPGFQTCWRAEPWTRPARTTTRVIFWATTRKLALQRSSRRPAPRLANFDALDRVVHTSFGDFKAREYLWQINMFRGLRAHDIAKVIGAGVELPADLVQGIWDEISPHAEEWRKMGVFPEAVAVPSDAPLLDRLLGLTGRDPKGP